MQDHDTDQHPIVAALTGSPAGREADPLLDLVESAPRYESTGLDSGPQPTTGSDDFLAFYGLQENPFADAVHPGYFYRTQSHGEAIGRMLMAVRHRVSLGMVTGASGTGKTLVSQILLQHLDPAVCEPILVLVTPGLSRTGLLREILSELNVALPLGISRTQDLVRLLGNHVIDLHREGRRLVILIDECHFLTADSLHILRTISNIEVPECKLVTCLLFGEPRFAKRLDHPSFESIRNRMYMRCELQALGAGDCVQYVQFRLMVAQRLEPLFEPDALVALHELSGGVCRSLSKLCMLSLIVGAHQGRRRVDAGLVAAAAQMAGLAPPDRAGEGL